MLHALQCVSLSPFFAGVCAIPPAQAVARRVAYQTFNHVLELDITFHMNRRTGRLSRILERGMCTSVCVCACELNPLSTLNAKDNLCIQCMYSSAFTVN